MFFFFFSLVIIKIQNIAFQESKATVADIPLKLPHRATAYTGFTAHL